MKRIVLLLAGLLLLAVFFGVNVVSSQTLRGIRLDMTESKIYTLSEAGRRVARSPDEPVTLRYFVSADLLRADPRLAGFATFVGEQLEAFERASGGKVELEVIDPEPQSEAEDRAIGEGLRPIPTRDGNAFFGLVGTNALDGREVIPIFNFQDPRFEAFLEFEIASLIDRLGTGDRPRVGLLTSLPMRGGGFDPRTGQPGAPGYQLVAELESQFEVVDVLGDELPPDLDALLGVHPKNMSDDLAYAIDQFLLRGGDAVFFLDPLCETDPAGQDPRNPLAAMNADRSSAAIPTLDAWGVSLADGRVAGDLASALEIPARQGGGTVRALQYLRLGEGETIDPDDPATGRLGTLIVGAAGVLERADDAAVEWEPLVRTSENAAPIDASRLTFFADPTEILADFQPAGEIPLAVRLRGQGVPSAFPDGPPAEPSGAAEEGPPDNEDENENGGENAGHLATSTAPISVVVVADADMLADQYWVRRLSLGGLTLGFERVSDNGAFALNLLDQLAGSGNLIELRARGDFFRPLAKLDEMRQAADAELAAQTAALDERIAEAERRINEIQQGRTDAGEITSLYLTPEQESALEEAQRAIAEARTERRQIRFELNRDIEALETRLTLLNTALVPGALCLFAVGLGGYRVVRRRADRRRAGARS